MLHIDISKLDFYFQSENITCIRYKCDSEWICIGTIHKRSTDYMILWDKQNIDINRWGDYADTLDDAKILSVRMWTEYCMSKLPKMFVIL